VTTYHHSVPLSRNLGALTSWNTQGLSRPVTGLLYLFLLSGIGSDKEPYHLTCQTCDDVPVTSSLSRARQIRMTAIYSSANCIHFCAHTGNLIIHQAAPSYNRIYFSDIQGIGPFSSVTKEANVLIGVLMKRMPPSVRLEGIPKS